jgi:hypothetical protein
MSADLPDMDDAFMRAAFDPSFKLPPIVPPIDHELHRIEAAAMLLEAPCHHCNAEAEALAGTGSLPRVIGFTHEKDCPNWLP